jgi:hypothetical protein
MKTATTTNASDEECVKDCRQTIDSIPVTVSLRPRQARRFGQVRFTKKAT